MAYNYENLPVLSKVKIGDSIYYLKDADVRKILDTFGTAVTYNVDATVTAESANLATQDAIVKYVASQIGDLASAMNFRGSFAPVEDKTAIEVIEANITNPTNGDVVLVGTAEYIYSDNTWKLFGDEGIYATIAGVDAAYVKKELTIAGIDLKDAITTDELKTALDLKGLSHKDSASGSITVVTGVQAATYTPAGGVGTTLTHTSTAMASSGTFTPSGSVTGNVTATGSVAIARDDTNGVQISGTVSTPTITVTPNTEKIKPISSLGTLPKYTASQYSAPSVNETKAKFASEGLLASVNDEETLIFTAASKTDALTSTGFNAGSYTPAEYVEGTLPSYGEDKTIVVGIASATASAPTFTGDKFGATFSGDEVAIAATFSGSEGAISVSGNYDKATSAASTFSGTEATITHEVTSEAKTVTVS